MVSLILKGRFGPRYSIINGRWKKERKIGKNLERPFIVKKVLSNGTYLLIIMEGDMTTSPINACFLKRYFRQRGTNSGDIQKAIYVLGVKKRVLKRDQLPYYSWPA